MNVLRHLQHFTYDILNTSEEFTAEIPLGNEITFDLGVDSSRRQYWRVTNYDSGICRVKIRNIRNGLFRHEYKTTVKITALRRGHCTLVLDSAPKTFIVHITVY